MGPIWIDARILQLGLDPLFFLSSGGLLPEVFVYYAGRLDAKGNENAGIALPNIAQLVGITIHSAFVTVDPSAPSGIGSISSTFSFTVTK